MSSVRVLVLSLGWLALTQPAAADVVVGTGTASSCTEAAFGAAVASVSAAGGTITFNCGGPATITVTSQKLFQNFGNPNLVYAIDGGGIITLSGGSTTRILYHTSGTLNLRNVTFSAGRAQGADDNASGGAVRSDAGIQPAHLNLTNVTFNGNFTNLTTAPSPPFSPYDYGGGALFTRFGIVTITNCSFNNNTANNTAGGALHIRSSTVAITGSLFNANASNGGGLGGAIHVDGVGNTPPGGPGEFNGTLQISTTSFIGNTTRNQGGAIFFYLYPPKNESVTFDTINVTGNQVVDSSGPLGNTAYGGGISGNYGNVTILNSTIANNIAHSNTAGGSGGGLVLSGSGAITIWNSTISGNRGEGPGNGGGLTIFNNTQPFDILHTTIANNFAGGSGGGIFTSGGSGTLRNSIVANNTAPSGQQCQATMGGGGVIQWPNNNPSCISGVSFVDPQLGPLAFNGGFSNTHLPGAASPAIDLGTCVVARDQRGVARPQGPFCDLGAVEVAVPSPAVNYYTLSPCRVLDTRLAGGPTGGAPLTCGVNQAVAVGGACGVPAGAKAFAGNVAVTQPSTGGFVSVFPGSFPPQTATVNYSAGQTRGNNAIIAISAGQVAARCAPSGTAHVIIDVSGYFQ